MGKSLKTMKEKEHSEGGEGPDIIRGQDGGQNDRGGGRERENWAEYTVGIGWEIMWALQSICVSAFHCY